MPEKKIRIHSADAPWMNQKIKSLILKRQKAFNTHGVYSPQFKYYRNGVNRERKPAGQNITNPTSNNLKGKPQEKSADTNLSDQC